MARAFVLLLYSVDINTTISLLSMNIMHNHALSREKIFWSILCDVEMLNISNCLLHFNFVQYTWFTKSRNIYSRYMVSICVCWFRRKCVQYNEQQIITIVRSKIHTAHFPFSCERRIMSLLPWSARAMIWEIPNTFELSRKLPVGVCVRICELTLCVNIIRVLSCKLTVTTPITLNVPLAMK